METWLEIGTLRFTPQAPPNVEIPDPGSCRIEFTVDVVKMPTIDQAPGFPGVQTVFIADNTQWTIGQAGPLVNSARGTDNSTISKKTPSLTTNASATGVVGSTTLTDTANVFGRVNPGAAGTVSFRLYGPNDTSCSAAPVFEDLDKAYPATGGPLSSAAFTPTDAGTYRWIASYSGDINNAAVSGSCDDANESTIVTPTSPTITTAASDDVALGGGALVDTATVSGTANVQAGGTVTFNLYGPDDVTCANAPVATSTQPYLVTGEDVTSLPYTPTVPGVYQWVAAYSGDGNNNPVSGACGDAAETTAVAKAQPIIVTDASDTIAIGGELTDAATVTGRVSPLASTIDFSLYGPDNTDCSGTPVFTSVGVATYNGDVNNESAVGTCGDPADTGMVDFRLYGPNDATCAGAPVFESLAVAYPTTGGSVSSAAFVPTLPGVYRWVATYRGDSNNSEAVGVCGDPAETVTVSPTPDVGTELPATGPGGVASTLAIGFGALLAGALLLSLSGRRRRFGAA